MLCYKTRFAWHAKIYYIGRGFPLSLNVVYSFLINIECLVSSDKAMVPCCGVIFVEACRLAVLAVDYSIIVVL